jgi:hypothetical protein
VPSEDQLPPRLQDEIKPEDYIGLRWEQHLTTMTNDPSAGYWLDGLPAVIDPRAYKAFIIPGDFENPDFSFYPSYTNDARTVNRKMFSLHLTERIHGMLHHSGTGDLNLPGTRYHSIPGPLSQRFRSSSYFLCKLGNLVPFV